MAIWRLDVGPLLLTERRILCNLRSLGRGWHGFCRQRPDFDALTFYPWSSNKIALLWEKREKYIGEIAENIAFIFKAKLCMYTTVLYITLIDNISFTESHCVWHGSMKVWRLYSPGLFIVQLAWSSCPNFAMENDHD